MDDLSAQVDEIEALVAIYGKEWQTDDEENRAYSIEIGEKEKQVKLYVKLPKNYPSVVSPIYEISAPHLDQSQKICIGHLLEEVCLTNVGQNIIYQLVERVREALQSDIEISAATSGVEDHRRNADEIDAHLIIESRPMDDFECPVIIHGEVILDRKSSFQGHAATVFTTTQVKQVLHKLYENKKIKQATHNMFAYRIYRVDSKSFVQDCEDDGESQAGGRLLHFLQIIEAKNVLVVVSRWYGGIHLGSDRFRHINNAARQVLTAADMIPEKNKKK